MAKKLVTEKDIVEAARKGLKSFLVDEHTVLTPSARDAAVQYRIELSRDVAGSTKHGGLEEVRLFSPHDPKSPTAKVVVALGSDHGGFSMKEMLRSFIVDLGYTVADVGTNSEQACDYPDFAYAVASMVAQGSAHKGIMIDGVGVASAIVANKIPGVRAVPCYSEFVAQSSREHNDANVLTLGGRVLGSEAAKSIVKLWLSTWFGGGRHQQRVNKIADIEKRYMK